MNSKIVFADEELAEAFKKLDERENKKLLNGLNKAFDDLAEDAFCGIQIAKRLIPKEYIKKYKIDNLWKYNLPEGWRLLYSVARDEVIVISIILEWMKHKDYEKKMKY